MGWKYQSYTPKIPPSVSSQTEPNEPEMDQSENRSRVAKDVMAHLQIH